MWTQEKSSLLNKNISEYFIDLFLSIWHFIGKMLKNKE